MVDNKQVCAALIIYAAEPSQGNYNELWILCWQRMRALCFTRYGAGSDPEDLDDIINTATISVLNKLQSFSEFTTDSISKTFYWTLRSAAEHLFRKKTRRNKLMKEYIKEIERSAKIVFRN